MLTSIELASHRSMSLAEVDAPPRRAFCGRGHEITIDSDDVDEPVRSEVPKSFGRAGSMALSSISPH